MEGMMSVVRIATAVLYRLRVLGEGELLPYLQLDKKNTALF